MVMGNCCSMQTLLAKMAIIEENKKHFWLEQHQILLKIHLNTPQVLNARFDNSHSTVALSSKRNSQRCTMLSWHTLVAFVHSQSKVDKNEQRTRICFSGLWIVSILSPSLNSIQEYQHVSSFHQMCFKDWFQFISPRLWSLQTGTKKSDMQDQTCTRSNMHNSPSILDLSRVRSHKFSIAAMCNAHNKRSNVFERFCIHNVRLLPPGGFGTGCCRKSISRGKHLHHPLRISAPNRSLHSRNPWVYSSSTRIQNVSLYLKLAPNQNQRFLY